MTEREKFEGWYLDRFAREPMPSGYESGIAWEAWQARAASPKVLQGEPVVEVVWAEGWSETVRELKFIDPRTSFDIPVGTKFYLHPPKQALPQGVEEWIDMHSVGAVLFDQDVLCVAECDLRAYLSGMAIAPVDAIPAALPMEPFQTIDMGSKNYKAGWNACRVAMLAAAKEKGE